MADFTSGFWSAYIAILTALSIAFCLFLLIVNSRKPPATADNTTGHVWDEDLTEYSNPLPRWWMWLFDLTVLFALVYLVLSPGLGGFGGALGWSSQQRFEAEMAEANRQFGPLYEKCPCPRLTGWLAVQFDSCPCR